jgi:predicted MFS family arabinose efflux permease
MLARSMSQHAALRPDRRRIYAVQGVRAFAYGFGSVILGASLARAGLSGTEVGLVFAALLAGSALASFLVTARADRLGRRLVYRGLLAAMGIAGAIFALTESLPLLILAALTGTVSVDVVESGPFTSLEQAMLPGTAGPSTARAFGVYNAVAAVVGSAGALAAGGPELLRAVLPAAPPSQRWLLLYPAAAAVALVIAAGFSDGVEPPADTVSRSGQLGRRRALERSRRPVLRLAGLFAVDSFAGGFIVQSFLVYWFTEVLGASTVVMGVALAAAGLVQAGSFLAAPRIAARIGLLNTMVFTHLPSNVLLALIPLVRNLPGALALLVARFALSQMDVPTRQAYLAALAGPAELSAAASVTNATRTAVRPLAPPLAGAAVGTALPGLPFFLAGGLKIVYDLALYAWFRKVPVEGERGQRVRRPAPPKSAGPE